MIGAHSHARVSLPRAHEPPSRSTSSRRPRARGGPYVPGGGGGAARRRGRPVAARRLIRRTGHDSGHGLKNHREHCCCAFSLPHGAWLWLKWTHARTRHAALAHGIKIFNPQEQWQWQCPGPSSSSGSFYNSENTIGRRSSTGGDRLQGTKLTIRPMTNSSGRQVEREDPSRSPMRARARDDHRKQRV
jgi:hypothetical protein